MLILAIDPGAVSRPANRRPSDPEEQRHGWCTLRILPDQRPEWCDAGHDLDAEVSNKLRAIGVNVVAVERPAGYIHEHARGAALLETAYAAGLLMGRAEGAGKVAHAISAEQWRGCVVGLTSPSDAQVKAALGRLLTLPARSNAHERDACGVGLGWALRSGALVGGKGRRLPAVAP